jgi:hypothetical protein
MIRTSYASVTVGAAVLLAAALGTSGAARVQNQAGRAAPASCSRMADPYKLRVAQLLSCGDHVFSLGRVSRLSGGGRAYSYPGAGITITLPPPRFNPLRATDRQLSEYGFPTRRWLGAKWYGVVRHMRHPVAPPRYLVALNARAAVPRGVTTSAAAPRGVTASAVQGEPCSNSQNDACWGGYYAQYHAYFEVDSRWWEPTFTTSSCQTTAWVQWVGLGDIFGNDLGQDGTTFNVPNAGAHQAFIAKVSTGDQGDIVPVDLYATPGYQFFAQVTWDSTNSWYDFSLVNEHTDNYMNPHSSPVSGYDDQSAEVMTEDPLIGGQWTYLSNFGQYLVDNAEAGYGSGGPAVAFNELSTESDAIENAYNNTTMASPGNFIGSSSNWNMYFSSCK